MASEEEHSQIILVQTEAERVRFMVRSYMRTRIHKVCIAQDFFYNNSTTLAFHFETHQLTIDRKVRTSYLGACRSADATIHHGIEICPVVSLRSVA